jgi:[ribosomal protein S5]-alanine N-acetyltransferase
MIAAPASIQTERLRLVPVSAELARLELRDRAAAAALGAVLPPGWPPEFYDDGAMRFTLERLEEAPSAVGWWAWYFIGRRIEAGRDALIGIGGFKGPPNGDGLVEVGYSVVERYQRRGYATEAISALISWARETPSVKRIAGETLPELIPSIRVLEKLGFTNVGAGSEAGVVRYERAV